MKFEKVQGSGARKAYIKKGECCYNIMDGFWSDTWTFESLHKASKLVKEKNERLG